MVLRPVARWRVGEADLDLRLIALLRAIARHGSLNRAVSALRLSYRHAWGLVGNTERVLGKKLVMMERGRGARLSAFAERLIAADDAAVNLLGDGLADMLASLNREASEAHSAPLARPMTVHASHDLALAALRDHLAAGGPALLDLHFRGSLDCLAALGRGDCEIAGFHVPEPSAGTAAFAPYRRWLRIRGLRLVRFVIRRQGLMVPRDNPKRLRTLEDIVKSEARFVNRQPESGTRLAFDRLLAAASLRPAQVKGYQVEEFTHAAVAATVASGMADAGFGIEAAARQAGLEFVPLASERYYLAARAQTLATAPARAVLEAMASPGFLKRVAALPGYDAIGIGDTVAISEALRAG
jgi:molybdate transport repressor ModE-like protein